MALTIALAVVLPGLILMVRTLAVASQLTIAPVPLTSGLPIIWMVEPLKLAALPKLALLVLIVKSFLSPPGRMVVVDAVELLTPPRVRREELTMTPAPVLP